MSPLRFRDGAVVARHDAVVGLTDARRPSSSSPATDPALSGAALVLLRRDLRGLRRPPGGGAAEAALARACRRGRRVACGAAAQGGGRVGVGGAPRARQGVDADSVRRSPVTVNRCSSATVLGTCTGNPYKAVPQLRECCRQAQAEEVSNSRNKIQQTWERPYRDSLYLFNLAGSYVTGRLNS